MENLFRRNLETMTWKELERYTGCIPPNSLVRRIFDRLDKLREEEVREEMRQVNTARDEALKTIEEHHLAAFINIANAIDELEKDLLLAVRNLPYNELSDYIATRFEKFNDEEDPRNE